VNKKYKAIFILGAGSSHELDMPLGSDLKHEIASLYSSHTFNIPEQMKNKQKLLGKALELIKIQDKLPTDYFEEAINIISNSLPFAESIDNFIHNHQGDETIALCGKLGIALSIISAESDSLLVDDFNKLNSKPTTKLAETWFAKLMQKIVSGKHHEEAIKNSFRDILFINFNYDRCLERFIFLWLKNYFGWEDYIVQDICNALNVIRPYGSLGSLPWKNKQNAVAYGSQVNEHQLISISKRIKTFTEGVNSHQRDTIHSAILNSQKNIYLGFAFHPLNMELLKPNLSYVSRKPYSTPSLGTAYKMSTNDVKFIKHKLNTLGSPSPRDSNMILHSELKCSQLFEEHNQELHSLLT